MADKVNGTIKEKVNESTAIIRVVSYGYYNEFDYENRDELKIKFTNINNGHSVEELGDNPIEISIESQPTNLDEPICGKGKIIQIMDSEIFI
mgnify:CR=1 FL=1